MLRPFINIYLHAIDTVVKIFYTESSVSKRILQLSEDMIFMPPKPKFTREEIVSAALQLVSASGVEALTARELGVRLGSSARPIFTVFKNMDELLSCVRDAAMKYFEAFCAGKFADMPRFKRVGMKMVLLGIHEPHLFKLLFMHGEFGFHSFDELLSVLGDSAERSLDMLKEDNSLDRRSAKTVFENMWIFTFGLGVLCANGSCAFSEAEVSDRLSCAFNAIMLQARYEKTENGDRPAAL